MVLIKRGFRLAGKQGHGLFVTTSRFSQKAKDYSYNQHIILVDGVKLANLMIKHNFCVSTRKRLRLKRLILMLCLNIKMSSVFV
ncbi:MULTISPECIES: restriction endonuclease [Gardnerella]|uniref:Restriction endonuclease n=2 Tax=Bifidobacteriaceae TaxID=31953 RepID=A0ABU5MQ68_9BIFI|nr:MULTISPECIES: restriction endonuclease [Gardnerella]MDZ7544565.1 restriction endonuclease [Gardnerella piotii]MDZ7552068.1 restriction endonuclease [Gardnerella piotii]